MNSIMRRAMLLAVMTTTAIGCKNPASDGASIAWAEVAKGTESTRGITPPPACAHKGDGKVYAVEGFPHWAESDLCRGDDCNVRLYQKNAPDGSPMEDSSVGYVPLIVAMKGALGGFVEKPELANASSTTSGVTSNKRTTTSGSLVPDSLKLHLSDGTAVNNRVRIRAFFEIADTNGICELKYRGGVKL
jgi:hypothetical protein